jgi:Ca2+-binding RTX toxin-like protein
VKVSTLSAYSLVSLTQVENLVVLTETGIEATGNALANTITGNAGDDTLDGGGGNDKLIGGLGDDHYLVNAAGDNVVEKSGEGTDTIQTTVSLNLANPQRLGLTNVENLTYVGATNATLGGNALDNVIRGGDLNDVIAGGTGADTLYGGLGADRLTGGTQADQFVFDTTLGGTNIDVIVGFRVGDDQIVLDDAIFDQIGGALLDDAFVRGRGTTAVAGDADDRIIYDQATGNLWYDADGIGEIAAIRFAVLSPNLNLTAAEFAIL